MYYMAIEPEQREAMIVDEPPMPLEWRTEKANKSGHVYLGGIAEWLANQAGNKPPAWVYNADRFSKTPIYPYDYGCPRDDEQKKLYREWALPELAKRNFFANDRLHERSYRWIQGFDPEHTRQRRELGLYHATLDLRAVRLMNPYLEEGHGVSKAEIDLRQQMMGECIKNPGRKLEDVLAKHGVTAEALDLDLSPLPPPRHWLPKQPLQACKL